MVFGGSGLTFGGLEILVMFLDFCKEFRGVRGFGVTAQVWEVLVEFGIIWV